MSAAPAPAPGWIPLAVGALDVRGATGFAPEAEVLVLPTRPGDALCLIGTAADLWRRLVETAPVPPSALGADENALLEELLEHGLTALRVDDPARVTALCAPVLSSATHELVYALVARLAAAHGIRCVFVKGPALHHQGLRDREHSGDVDVWCDPPHIETLVTALESWGWRRSDDPWRGTAIHHSVTLSPGAWGCEIDVHRRFPGLVLDDAAAFEEVYRNATPLRYAGVDVLVPARDTHAVLAALHAVRPVIGAGAPSAGASAAAQELLGRADGAVPRARELGAVPALRRELEPLAASGELAAYDVGVPRDWLWRAEPNRVRAYAVAMRPEPWRVRVRLVLRLLWPPDDVALTSARLAGESSSTPRRARWSRLRRGVREWLATRR